ncbi:MAG: c-type cytochrome [Verrucomicrobiales bacterium]|nr:c-type cytochrome [Verrucomicrobiales bacterium]
MNFVRETRLIVGWMGLAGGLCLTLGSAAVEPPVMSEKVLEAQLLAQEPLVHQPVSLVLDAEDRVLVIENHTLPGPGAAPATEGDAIVWLLDGDGDGLLDQRKVFWQGAPEARDLAWSDDGWLLVSCRREILRLRDTDGDDVADEVQRGWVQLDMEGDGVDTGLTGLAVAADGGVYVGLGENAGVSLEMKFDRGIPEFQEAEGGGIWRVDRGVRRPLQVARGLWSPFGLCITAAGDLFAADNDPDSREPCRLIHVTSEGDYGFQSRYGCDGVHPFQSWEGERLGTLPPLAPVGEGAGGLLGYVPAAHPQYRGLPAKWVNRLLVASWAEHRIDGYLTQSRKGSSTFDAAWGTLCQGGLDFCPVDLAMARDGSLIVSDWGGNRIEPSGKGRIWRIQLKQVLSVESINVPPVTRDPSLDWVDEILTGPPPTADQILEWLQASEPRLFHAAVERLSREGKLAKSLVENRLQFNGRVRAGLLLASRRGTEREGLDMNQLPPEVDELVRVSLMDADPQVLLLALHWVADHQIRRYAVLLEGLVTDASLTPDLLRAVITAKLRSQQREFDSEAVTAELHELLENPALKGARLRLALRALPREDPWLSVAKWKKWISASDGEEQRWLIHFLGQTARDAEAVALLAELAFSADAAPAARAAALAHLIVSVDAAEKLVPSLESEDLTERAAALAALVGLQPLPAAVQRALQKIEDPQLQDAVARARGEAFVSRQRPGATETDAWLRHLDGLAGEPSIERGREVFMTSRLGACSRCHEAEGLGEPWGPDLAADSRESNAWRNLLHAMLQPSAEVAVEFAAYQMLTADRQIHLLMPVAVAGGRHRFLNPEGRLAALQEGTLVQRVRAQKSLMPAGLVDRLTDQEVRDLLAYLTSLKKP